jgi:L-methionine (R)-S-oxide reductase
MLDNNKIELIKHVETIFQNTDLTWQKKLNKVCSKIHQKINYYDWVGFYFSNHINKELHLKSFSGEPTEHTRISFGKGVCGQVALSNKALIVNDVNLEDNYVSCNLTVKSEIVVPIFVKNENIGQIDIDSKSLNAFSIEDQFFLENICSIVSKNHKLI